MTVAGEAAIIQRATESVLAVDLLAWIRSIECGTTWTQSALGEVTRRIDGLAVDEETSHASCGKEH